MTWTVEQTSPTVTTIRIPVNRNREWEQWALITSDRHIDSPKSDRSMQRRHLEQARERGAFVLDLGDLYDAMQGKHDRRSSKSDLGDDYRSPDYLGDLVRNAFDFFSPYKESFALLGIGNHETGIVKHAEFDLLRALVDRLRDNGSQVVLGGYRGWVRLMFQDAKGGGYRKSLNIAYIHGSGGGGPVTKGTIKTNRRAVIYPDADIQVSGHIHEGWSFPIPRVRLTDSGRERSDEQVHLAIPSYKDAITNHAGGFEVEREHQPKPKGAWWLRFFFDRSAQDIDFEYMRAK